MGNAERLTMPEFLINLKNTFARGKVWLSVYAFLLSAAVVVGRQMRTSAPYEGLISENYFIPFSVSDLFLLILFAAFFFLVFGVLHCAASIADTPREISEKDSVGFFPVFLLICLLWLPYLLTYWPGFLFADTENSILQAVGLEPLNNRNPLLYTIFIRLCILIAGGFRTGDLTASMALCSIFQMLYVSACLSFMICHVTLGLKKFWPWLLALLFGLSPYFAALSIAGWKDPVFCASVAAYSVLMFDFARSRGAAAKFRRWRILWCFLSVMILFWRNNGFCVVGFSLLFSLVFTLINRKDAVLRRLFLRLSAASAAFLLLWGTVVVPVYKLMGIGTPKEEMAGMMLNQMACTAAYGGEMSLEEAEYLDSLIPMELYPEIYRPCCVDMLKWDSHFNYGALEGSRFLRVWASLGLKNPKLYLEAWAMESYGFWTVNHREINLNRTNISYGVPLSGEARIGSYTVSFRNLLGNDRFTEIFPKDSWSVPVGIINWAIFFIFLSVIKRDRGILSLALAPQIGISLGLIAATPIYYLPRYGASAQYLIPLYLLIFFRSNTVLTCPNSTDH